MTVLEHARWRIALGANDLILLDSRIKARRESVAPDMDEAEYFDLFVAEQVLKNLQPGLSGLLHGLVDGEGDCGIDGFYCFVNDQLLDHGFVTTGLGRNPRVEVVITQCKTTAGFSEQVIEKLAFHLPKLLQFERDEKALSQFANDRILELTRLFLKLCTDIAPLNPRITFFVTYATRGDDVHPNVRSKSGTVGDVLRKCFPGSLVHFEFLGAAQLLASAQQSAQIAKVLPIAEGPLASDSEHGQAYVALVRLKDYFHFICEPGSSELHAALFEANVRDHQGASNVNRSIGHTLNRTNGADFWWLNNGVTIVAPEVQQMGKKFHMTDPQIVNGLQTSNEIHRYFRDHSEEVDRHLMVRVVVATEEPVRDSIIRATNNQNQLPDSALRATDRFQYQIEEYLGGRGFYYDRRKNYHLNQGRPLDRIISLEEMAQCVVSCLSTEPWRARAHPTSLLDDELYSSIFNANKHPLNMYLNSLLLVRHVRKALESHPQVSTGYVDDWTFHVSAVAAMLHLRRQKPSPKDLTNTDFLCIPTARILDLVPVVAREYLKRLSRTTYTPLSDVASDDHVSRAIIKRTESLLVSSRWRDWPDKGVAEDSDVLHNEVFFRRPRRTRG
jgi:hypothetical protein